MAQKILATRSSDAALRADFADVHVDQIVLARAPGRVHAEAVASGLKKTGAEVAIAYDGRCVGAAGGAGRDPAPPDAMLAHGVLLGRAGVGFPAPVHLERFASPARLCVTDEPRLAGVGGVGMLTLVVPTAALAQALVRGTVSIRPPVSVQVLLTGKLRPFVCASDAARELLRRGIGDVVRRVDEARGAPVVIEFTGPSARALSVGERSVLAGMAPLVGAAGAIFVSDERTEVFLRDQRRSKAYRALAPDAGAPCEEVVGMDLGAVDPLLVDDRGEVRAVRDMLGRPVAQVLLGGDRGATLRDLFAVATLLKSKRIPPRLDFLLAVPSRQMLEVLSRAGALTDLIATGARLVEPDAGVIAGELYAPSRPGVGLRTCDPEPMAPGPRALVASAETLAYAVATGEVGDPRSFKRPVRVTVPRAMPTDDVLVARKGPRAEPGQPRPSRRELVPREVAGWRGAQTLELVTASACAAGAAPGGRTWAAVACATLDEVRWLSSRATTFGGSVRAVLAPFIPRPLVALLSAAGIAAIVVDASTFERLQGKRSVVLPEPSRWPEGQSLSIEASGDALPMTLLALGAERDWIARGSEPLTRGPAHGPAQRAGGVGPGGSGGAAGGLARARLPDSRRPAAER
jgi:aconitate hydratase